MKFSQGLSNPDPASVGKKLLKNPVNLFDPKPWKKPLSTSEVPSKSIQLSQHQADLKIWAKKHVIKECSV